METETKSSHFDGSIQIIDAIRPQGVRRLCENHSSGSLNVQHPLEPTSTTPALRRRCSTMPARSACQRAPDGLIFVRCSGNTSSNRSRTSLPTSYAKPLIAGPIQARTCFGDVATAASPDSMMPATRPRQPTCRTATNRPPRSVRNNGAQSAVSTAQIVPARRVRLPSPNVECVSRSLSMTMAPCCCCSQPDKAGHPKLLCSNRRLVFTDDFSSPT